METRQLEGGKKHRIGITHPSLRIGGAQHRLPIATQQRPAHRLEGLQAGTFSSGEITHGIQSPDLSLEERKKMNLFGDAMQAKQPGLWFWMDRSTTRGQQWCSKASKGEPLSERVRPDGAHTLNANLAVSQTCKRLGSAGGGLPCAATHQHVSDCRCRWRDPSNTLWFNICTNFLNVESILKN